MTQKLTMQHLPGYYYEYVTTGGAGIVNDGGSDVWSLHRTLYSGDRSNFHISLKRKILLFLLFMGLTGFNI